MTTCPELVEVAQFYGALYLFGDVVGALLLQKLHRLVKKTSQKLSPNAGRSR